MEALKKTKLLNLLKEFIDLPIFKNERYIDQVRFKWMLQSSGIGLGDVMYEKHEDAIQNIPGISLGFNLIYSDHRGIEYNNDEATSRYRARILIRQCLLKKDDCQLEEVIHHYEPNRDNEMINVAVGSLTEGIAMMSLGLKEEHIPEGLDVSKLKFDRIKEPLDLDKYGLSENEVFNLFLYGSDIHRDKDKHLLYKAYKEQFGDFFETVIDFHMLILFRLSSHIFIPLLKSER